MTLRQEKRHQSGLIKTAKQSIMSITFEDYDTKANFIRKGKTPDGEPLASSKGFLSKIKEKLTGGSHSADKP